MRQRFDNQALLNKKQLAEFLSLQIQEKQQQKREEKILQQAHEQTMMQIPKTKFQFHSIFDNQDLQKRQKLQQQMLEQDICNYNRMVADQKKSFKNQRNSKSVDSQTTLIKFPKISSPAPKTAEKITLQIPNLSKSYVFEQSSSPSKVEQPITSSKNPQYIDRNEFELNFENQRNEIKKRNQELEDLRRKMHENYLATKQQVASLLDFVKYNQQQRYQYQLLQKQLEPLVKSEPVYVYMKELELKKEIKYFHYNEFMEQVNEELKNTSNYISMQAQNIEQNDESFDFQF